MAMPKPIRLTVQGEEPVEFTKEELRVINAVSPTVDLERVEDGVMITVHDLNGTQSETVYDGVATTFVFDQPSAEEEWTIVHNLNRFPSVTVVDSSGSVCIGEVLYIDENTVKCVFSAPFAGVAYLN